MNVCPSVCLSHVSNAETVQNIEIRFATYHRTTFLAAEEFRNPDFRDSPRTNALKRGTPYRQRKFDQYSAISWKSCELGDTLILFRHRKSHKGFQLKPKVVTLNDLEPRTLQWPSVILRHFTQSGSSWSHQPKPKL